MKLNFKNKVCPNCETENTFICEEQEKYPFSLKGYKQLKDKEVFKCEHCGFCSYNFDYEIEPETKDFVNGEIYTDKLTRGELNGLEELDLSIVESYNAYQFESASLVHAMEEQFDIAFIALFKTIQLKNIIKEKYYVQMLADKDELTAEEIEQYKELVELLEVGIENNFKNLLVLYANTEKNYYEKLLLIEASEIAGYSENAKKMYEQLTEEVKLPQDLCDYFYTLLNN